ncbi:UNVERIFIED_CONTAM: Dynein light chain roadblock-type 1 [Trichonephila clavipes]
MSRGIRTSMDNVTTTEMVNALVPLNDLARKTVKDLDPDNELLFFRIRTNKNEIMIGVGESVFNATKKFATYVIC